MHSRKYVSLHSWSVQVRGQCVFLDGINLHQTVFISDGNRSIFFSLQLRLDIVLSAAGHVHEG